MNWVQKTRARHAPSVAVTDADNILSPTGTALVRSPRSTAGLNRGGLVNSITGMGGSADKSDGSFFVPNDIRSREILQTLYVQSWVAAKFIDIPVDDMFIRGRQWESEDETAIQQLEDLNDELEINDRIVDTMKAGRLYGTAVLVLMTREAPLDQPLIIERLREGDLANLLVFDRYSLKVDREVNDLFSPRYGRPEIYELQPTRTDQSSVRVHASRVIRFDGRRALRSDGWGSGYQTQWGVSEIVAAITEIMNDASIAQNIAHLVNEASVPVIKTQNFRDSLMNNVAADEPSIDDIGLAINIKRSIYRTLFMDVNDEYERVGVTFGGLDAIMDRWALRLASMAGIPATRFLSRSPVGLNATGESDMKNYAIHVAALQKRMLAPKLKLIDDVMARHLGIGSVPEYQWLPLTDLTELEQAEVSYKRAEAVGLLLDRFAIDQDEAREMVSGDELFGELGPMPEMPDLPELLHPTPEPPVSGQSPPAG